MRLWKALGLGLTIGQADDTMFLTPNDLDDPGKPLRGTGYPKATDVKAIRGALGN